MKKKLSVTFLSLIIVGVFAFVFSVPQVKAATIAELQAQIQALLAQLQQLQNQLNQSQGGQTTQTTWCHNFERNLKIGDKGDEVKALRTALIKEGFDPGDIPGGYEENIAFSDYTASAVTAFQEKYASEILAPVGLSHGTGFVGPATRAKLNALYGCGVKPSISGNQPPVISGVSGPTTLRIGETGAWTVQASDPEKGVLTYSVVWGDEKAFGVSSLAPKLSTSTQTATFTHSYSKAGTYNPTFTVTDNQGLSAKTSLTVNVEAIISACTDSDGGLNYYAKGTATLGDRSNTDYCSGNYLYEQYCSAGGLSATTYYCPNGCQDGACVSETPSIQVLSPNGGEQWTEGSQVEITWKSSGIDRVYVYLLFPDGGTCYLGSSPASVGEHSFFLAKGMQCPNIPKQIFAGSGYKILLISDGQKVEDSSDAPFSIVSASSTVFCNPGQKIGDVNGDGKIDLTDSDLAMKVAIGSLPKPNNLCCIDLNNDGGVDISDVIKIVRIVDGLDVSSSTCPFGELGLEEAQSRLANISAAVSDLAKKIKEFFGR